MTITVTVFITSLSYSRRRNILISNRYDVSHVFISSGRYLSLEGRTHNTTQ